MTIEKDEGVSNESGKVKRYVANVWLNVTQDGVSLSDPELRSVILASDLDAIECELRQTEEACVSLTQQLAQLQAQNAELVNEVAGHHFVRNERDRLLEQNTAIQSRCEGLERALDIARIEQERFAAQSNKFAEILGGILHIIPPDFVTPDGKIMQFVPPDPLAYLRALANSISKAYAALSPSGKAGEGASPTSEGGGSV